MWRLRINASLFAIQFTIRFVRQQKTIIIIITIFRWWMRTLLLMISFCLSMQLESSWISRCQRKRNQKNKHKHKQRFHAQMLISIWCNAIGHNSNYPSFTRKPRPPNKNHNRKSISVSIRIVLHSSREIDTEQTSQAFFLLCILFRIGKTTKYNGFVLVVSCWCVANCAAHIIMLLHHKTHNTQIGVVQLQWTRTVELSACLCKTTMSMVIYSAFPRLY